MDPSDGNLVQTFSLGSNAEDFRSREIAGAGRPTECLPNHKWFIRILDDLLIAANWELGAYLKTKIIQKKITNTITHTHIERQNRVRKEHLRTLCKRTIC